MLCFITSVKKCQMIVIESFLRNCPISRPEKKAWLKGVVFENWVRKVYANNFSVVFNNVVNLDYLWLLKEGKNSKTTRLNPIDADE